MTPGGNRPVFVISQIGYSYCLSAPLGRLKPLEAIAPPLPRRSPQAAELPVRRSLFASVQRRYPTFRARLVIIPFMHHSEPYMSTNNTYG